MKSREIKTKVELRSNDETGNCALRYFFDGGEYPFLRDLEIWVFVHSVHKANPGKIMVTLKALPNLGDSDIFQGIKIPIFTFPDTDDLGSYEDMRSILFGDHGLNAKEEMESKLLRGANLWGAIAPVLESLVKLHS